MAIDKREYISSGNTIREYVVAGNKKNGSINDGMIFNINDSANPTLSNFTTISSTSPKNSNSYDVLYRSNGDIILPLVYNCDGAAEGGEATGRIIRYNSSLSYISEFSLGTIKANDLKIGVSNTSDGGLILTTTKQLLTPANSTEEFWNSDAYVAKYNSSYVLEWEKVIPNDIPVEPTDADLENEECVYNVIEHPNGGYLITGNISHNLDDDYLILLHEDCGVKYAYTKTGEDNIIPINSGETWSSSESVLGLVKISAGNRLTISGSSTVIQFADSKKTGIKTGIVVEPGGLLEIIDGAKLTALESCEGSMWDGITLLGNSSAVQSTAYQGKVYMRGEAVIEYARAAIYTGVKTIETFYYRGKTRTTKTGGIIDVQHAIFKDNYQSVVINAYSNPASPTYYSVISDNEFLTTDYMRDPEYVDELQNRIGQKDFISLSFIKSPTFENNSFTGASSIEVFNRGTAINSFTSALNATNNTFNDLTYGVYSSSINTLKGSSNINTNTFTNVRKGIMVLTSAYQNINNNDFVIPGYAFDIENPTVPALKYETWGVKLENSNSFNVSGNSYNAYDEVDLNSAWGSIVNNSMAIGGIIENDTYQNIAYGTQSEKANPNLSIKCNTYSNHFNAWSINPQSSSGSLKNQGEGSDNTEYQAGDIFDNVCSVANQDINSTIAFNYYAAQDAPVDCYSSNVHVDNSTNFNEYTCGRALFVCNSTLAECAEDWEDEIELEEDATKKQLMINYYIRALVANEQEDVALVYLQNNTSLFTDQNSVERILITSYYTNKDFSSATNLLNNYSIVDDNDQDFADLMDILLNADSLSADVFYLSENEISSIIPISENNTEAGYMAKAILKEIKGTTFNDAPELWGYEESEPSLTFSNQESRAITINNNETNSIPTNISLKVFPNPASNDITIESIAGNIDIYDMVGKKINSYTKGNGNLNINIQTLTNGVYFLKLTSNESEQKL